MNEPHVRALSRRDLLRIAGASGALALASACGTQPATSSPSPTAAAAGATPAATAAPAGAATATSSAPAATASSAPSPEAAEKPTAGATVPRGLAANTLVVAVDSDPQSLDPSTNLAYPVGSEIILNVFDTLVGWTPPTFDRLEGRLAESWSVSPDTKTYTFKIRQGVSFHDGTPCDASAIKAAMERVKRDNSFMTAYYGPIQDIAAADATTMTITLKDPSAVFLSYLAMPQAAIHSPTNAKQYSKQDIGAHPVGTGPFKFVSYTQNTEVVLAANPTYFRGRPALDGIVFRVIPDQATRRIELEKGTVDVVQQNGNLFSLPIADVKALKANTSVRVLEYPSQIVRYVQFNNTDSKVFQDKRVRQAFAMAIDYDGLVSGVLGNTAARLYGPLPESSWAVLPNVKDLAPKRDVAQARQLLAAAGQTNLTVKMPTFQGSSWQAIGTFLQANLREVGVNLQVQQMEFPPMRDLITAGKADLALGGRQPWYNDPDALLTIDYLSTLGPTALTFRMPKNDQLDGQLLKAEQGGSQADRTQLYQQIQRELIDYVPGLWLFNPEIIIYTRANVQNLVPNSAPPLTEYLSVKKG